MRTASTTTPTTRQREYLVFIKAFTDRWGIPPSFEELARHFNTSTPAVNGMVKTLEARGFLTRIPGAARTLRVLLSDDDLADPPVAPGTTAVLGTRGTAQIAATVDGAVHTACAAVERLVPLLCAVDGYLAEDAVRVLRAALDNTLQAAGASTEQRSEAEDALLRTATNALGHRTELRPGRKLAWWQRPKRR